MKTEELKYIPLHNASDIKEETLRRFDCGNADMTEYLHFQSKKDMLSGNGVTYVLVSDDRKRIYAYATIRAFALYCHDNAEKYHTKPTYEDGTVLIAVPAVEIKMFAVSKKLKHVVAYDMDPIKKRHYSTLFFKIFLEQLYYMSMDTIGFRIVFLRANDEGENLYRKNQFVDCNEYLNTFDEMADGCKPLMLTFENLENLIFTE